MKSIEVLREAQPEPKQSIERASFTFLDIETTGLYPERGARINEIAILRRGGDGFTWTQAKEEDTDESLSSVLPIVHEHLTQGVVVGHNVSFDLRFLAYESDRLGLRGPHVLFIDTHGLAKKFYDDLSDYQLPTLLEEFDISPKGPLHTAVVDARCTQALFWKLVNLGEIETLKQAGMKRLSWSNF